ncbi:MAG: hypothetical protein U0269_14420 [Polyangiales bacterium]
MTLRNAAFERFTRRALTAAATLAVLGVSTFAAGIEGCGGTTGLRRVSFVTRVGATESATPGGWTFANRAGWSVTLTEARAAIGPIYFNTLAPLESARRSPARPPRTVLEGLRAMLVPLAHADGESHFGGGRIVAEVNEQREVDLLDPTLDSFARPTQGVDEAVRTAEMWLYNRESMSNSVVRVRGTATRDGRTVPFSGALAIDPADATQEQPLDALRQVRGIPIEFIPDEEITVNLRVDLRPCFNNADFSELESSALDRDGTHHFSKNDNVGASFNAGLRSVRGTWNFRVEPKPTQR